jgi:hypothetical protein
MRFLLRSSLVLLATLNLGYIAVGQTHNSLPAHRAVPAKKYCQPDNGFCFRYPGSWAVLGEVFNGNGVVVAPAQNQDEALWDEVTVGLVVPSPPEGQDPTSIDRIIEQTMTSLREDGHSPETLQRQQRIVDSKPAQMLKIRYHDKKTDRDWIEELVFIEGPDSEIYSVALKCSPQSADRLQPAFAAVLESWKLPVPEQPPSVEEAAPTSKQPATEKPGSQETPLPKS